MGVAIDTVVFAATNPGAAPASDNAVVASGDSKAIKNFNPASRARLEWIVRQGTTSGFVGVKSPRFHDVVRGVQFIVSETPAVKLLPYEVSQPVYSGDTLQITLSGGAAEADGGAIGVYYDDLPGAAAKVYGVADILPLVRNIKPTEVDCAQGATAFAWIDTAITTTENLLKADTYYALLGYTVDVAALVVGIRAPETGNLRICGPGPTSSFVTDDYFLRMAQLDAKPYIPIFSANNRAGVTASLAGLATAGTTKVTLVLAELDQSFQPS